MRMNADTYKLDTYSDGCALSRARVTLVGAIRKTRVARGEFEFKFKLSPSAHHKLCYNLRHITYEVFNDEGDNYDLLVNPIKLSVQKALRATKPVAPIIQEYPVCKSYVVKKTGDLRVLCGKDSTEKSMRAGVSFRVTYDDGCIMKLDDWQMHNGARYVCKTEFAPAKCTTKMHLMASDIRRALEHATAEILNDFPGVYARHASMILAKDAPVPAPV